MTQEGSSPEASTSSSIPSSPASIIFQSFSSNLCSWTSFLSTGGRGRQAEPFPCFEMRHSPMFIQRGLWTK